MSRWLRLLGSLAVLVFLSASCAGTDPGSADAEVKVSEVTDEGVINQGENIRGRDGGYSGVRNGQSIWVFGDSVTEQANANGQNWFSNSWATSDDLDASDGIGSFALGVDSASGEPVELLPYTDEEKRFNDLHANGPDCVDPCGSRWALWPGSMVSDPARDRTLLFYKKIAGSPGEFNFFSVGAGLAIWPNNAAHPIRPIADERAEHPTLLFPTPDFEPGNASLIEGDWLYAFACDRNDRYDTVCRLARASLSQVLDLDQWEYATGLNSWNKDRSLATGLFFGADIMSVTFNSYLGRYIVVYSEPMSRLIQLRSAPSLTGPWSVATSLLDALPSASGNGWVYDGLTHPQYNEQGGRVIYVTYTRDPGDGWFSRELRLVRVVLGLAQ